VPPTSDIASCLLRDALVDTINILDFNRHAAAKYLADVDCYFSPSTFVKRATPFDKVKDVAGDGSTWKPEDVAVDAVFSQIFQLPAPEHKMVYYHSVLTESCKVAPAAVAPSLGRAIRFAYRNIDLMDLELGFRFMDWFSHHLSNFGFTWKWTEWCVMPNSSRTSYLALIDATLTVDKTGWTMLAFRMCIRRRLSLSAPWTRKYA
jgi:nuclear cap-binding protein subunit 1